MHPTGKTSLTNEALRMQHGFPCQKSGVLVNIEPMTCSSTGPSESSLDISSGCGDVIETAKHSLSYLPIQKNPIQMSDMASTILLIDESPVRTSADLSSWIDGDCVKAASKQRNNPTAPSSITETLDEERNGLESILTQQTVAEFNDSMETPIESGASTAIDEHHRMVPFTRSPVATRLLYDTIYNTLENWNNFKKPISHSKSDLSSVSWGKNDAMGTLAAQSHLSSHTEPKRTIPKSNLSRKLKSPEFNQEDSSNLLIPEEVIAKASNDPLLRPCVSRFGSDFVGRHLNIVSGRDDEWQEKLECSIHPFPELSERGNCDSFGESDIASFPVRDHGAPTLYNGDNHPLVRRFKNAYIKDTDFDFHSDPTSATGQMMPQKSAGGPYHQSPPSPFLKTNIMLSKSASAPTVREENVSKSTTVEKSDLTALTWRSTSSTEAFCPTPNSSHTSPPSQYPSLQSAPTQSCTGSVSAMQRSPKLSLSQSLTHLIPSRLFSCGIGRRLVNTVLASRCQVRCAPTKISEAAQYEILKWTNYHKRMVSHSYVMT